MPPTCEYHKPGAVTINEPGIICKPVEWVVAYLCNRCDANGTADLCERHYRRVYDNPAARRLGCSTCQGTISWVGERLDQTAAAESII
jgi:hypothetical protein